MKNIKKKTIYILMIIIMIIQSISNVVMAATEISKANLKNDHSIKTNLQYKNADGTWHNIICNYICYTNNGTKYPAYCIKHGVNGVDEEGSYTVNISKLLSDNKIWRTIINGYPYKTPSELGVETKDDAYLATKQAIYSVLLNRDVKSYYKGTNNKGKKVVNAIYNISQIGKKGTQKMQDANLKISKVKDLSKYNSDYYYQEYKVTSDVNISTYSVEGISSFPNGSYVTDTSGSKKTSFNSGDNFRVMISKSKITSDFTGKINIKGKCKTYPIFFGEAPKSGVQDYAITYDAYGDFTASGSFRENVNNSKIVVYKKDEESLKPIKGVKYELRLSGDVISTKETDSEGKITFENLYPENYELQEIDTNEKYILDSTKHKIEIGYNEVITKELTNKHKKGNLKILKVDKDDNDITLGAIEFDLLNEDKEIIAHLTTDADGEAYIENINVGNYILKETKTKKEYNLCVDEDIVVKWNETSKVTIENEKKKGQIRVIKKDKDHNEIKLSGVEFEVIDSKNRIVEKIVTDRNGEAITSRLPIGKYKIKEVSLGKNTEYILNDEIYTVDVTDKIITDLKIENEHKKGLLKITKVDKDSNSIPIENVEFEIMDNNGFKYTGRTNKNGILEISNIRTGKITIKEIKTRDEYVLSKEKYYLEIKYNKTSEITIENEKKKGQIEVYKTDTENNTIKLKDVEFDVIDENNNVVEKLTTNEKGYAITKRLPIGKYYLKETKTNNKYILKDELVEVDVSQDIISKLNITNEKKKGKISILKSSSSDSPLLNIKRGDVLKGAIFEIYDSDNTLVDTLITDENGQALSKDLEIGRYRIKEIAAAKNFLLNSKDFFINIQDNNEIKILNIENEPAIPELDIEKTGQEETYVSEEINYKFDIKNKGNVELEDFTWTEYLPYKQITVTKMITGTYNANLNYRLYYKTEKNDFVLFKELNTKQTEYIDFSNIKLSENDKIVQMKVVYDTVPVGFSSIVSPEIIVKTDKNVIKKDEILNYTELTGNYNGNPLKDASEWKTVVKEKIIDKKLPRTGC